MSGNVDGERDGAERASVRDLEERLELAMEAYCAWRKPHIDPYIYAENYEFLSRIDRLRRQIASASASDDDVVARMRLLDNWRDAIETGKSYVFTTPDGDYALSENAVTHAWLSKTPDGALEGPFRDAQEAADWAAMDWEEVFRKDPEP